MTKAGTMASDVFSRAARVRALVLACCGAIACSGSTANAPASSTKAGTSGPCDPLAPTPTTLGTVLGVGKDGQGTLYVGEVASTGEDRVFVSSGGTLVRKDLIGSGQSGGPPNAQYTFSFRDPFADIATARALLINTSGKATAMALGSGSNGKAFLGPATTGDEVLTVVDSSTVAGLPIKNLPHVPMYVADASDGTSVVVTWPMDAYGTDEARLYYGTPAHMIERPITSYSETHSGGADIAFTVDSATYSLQFSIAYGDPDASPLGTPGPVTLDKGGSTEPMTLRQPTPMTLSGFAFTCTGQ
jgi:hypothetical protein